MTVTQIPFDSGLLFTPAIHLPTGWHGVIFGLRGDIEGIYVVQFDILLDWFWDYPSLYLGRHATGNLIGRVPVGDVQLLSSGSSS